MKKIRTFFVTNLIFKRLMGEKEVRRLKDFEEIYELYFRDVYRYALSLTGDPSLAEEITQETFFKALRSIDKFDGKCRLYVWLCQIAKNTYFSIREKHKRRSSLSAEPDSGEPSPEDGLLRSESAFEIHRILHTLDEPYKEVFSLRALGELSFKQIGLLFGKSESWARVTYHRARLKIKEEME